MVYVMNSYSCDQGSIRRVHMRWSIGHVVTNLNSLVSCGYYCCLQLEDPHNMNMDVKEIELYE